MSSSRRRRGLRARRGALIARQPLLLDAVRFAQEDVGQQARPQPPVRAHGGNDRLAHLRRGDRGPIGVRAIEQQTIHPLGEASRERDRRAATRRAADQHDLLHGQLVEHRAQQRNLTVERQILVAHLAIRHTDTEPVVAHQRVALANRLPEPPKRLIPPVELQVTDPPRRRDQRRPLAGHRVRDTTTSEPQEADLRPMCHRRRVPLPSSANLAKSLNPRRATLTAS